MGIFKPAWMSQSLERAMDYVEGLSDEEKLLRVVLESPHYKARVAAVQKLKSDESFARLLKESENARIRCMAVKRVRKVAILRPYVSDWDSEVRYYALQRNGRSKEALDVVKTVSSDPGKGDASWILTITGTFSREEALFIALTTQNEKLAQVLVKNLDAVRLKRLMHEGNTCGAKAALESAKDLDTELLSSLAQTANSKEIRVAAQKKLEAAQKKLESVSPEAAEQTARAVRAREEAEIREETNRYIHLVKTDPLGSQLIKDMKHTVTGKQNRLKYELACVERYFAEKNAGNLSFRDEYDMRITLQKYLSQQDALCAYLLHENLDKGFACMMIREVNDETCLDLLAHQADCKYIRWKACKKNGGHVFDPKADEKERCICSVCGFVEHLGCPNNGHAWTCERCGAAIEPIPFVDGLPDSTIRYSDGTEKIISGYSGHYYDDDSFSY